MSPVRADTGKYAGNFFEDRFEKSKKNYEREKMRKLGKALIMLVCVLGLVIMFGSGCFQDLATPCHIDEKAIEYSEVDATSYLPWTTLWDAQRLRGEILYRHSNLQRVYVRLQEDDNAEVTFLVDALDTSVAGAREFQDQVFNPSGPVGMLLPTLFGGVLGSVFIKRPGDKSKKEVDLENAKTNS